MIDPKLMKRIANIMALAERGVDGEKATAQAMLTSILARHGLTLEDISDKPERKWVEVSFAGKHEHTLMCQTIRKVTQQRDFMTRQIKRTRSRFYVELSPAEHVEVEFLFEVMKRAFAEEMEKVMTAFLHTNNLHGPRAVKTDDEDDDKDEPELTPEERARMRQIAAMAMAMSPARVHKAIENK